MQDPRCYQIAVLTSLICFGVFALEFGIHWQNAVAIVAIALVAGGERPQPKKEPWWKRLWR